MSVRVMAWVWERSASVGAVRLVLLAIADHAHDDGDNAYPSMKTISEKARVDKRTAQRAVRELEALGELEVIPNAGQKGTHRYRVLMSKGRHLAPLATDHGGATPPPGGETPRVADDHGGISSPKGRSDATRTIKNHSSPQPPASGGPKYPPRRCKKHTKFRKDCDPCTEAVVAADAAKAQRERDRTTAILAEQTAAKKSAVRMPESLRKASA